MTENVVANIDNVNTVERLAQEISAMSVASGECSTTTSARVLEPKLQDSVQAFVSKAHDYGDHVRLHNEGGWNAADLSHPVKVTYQGNIYDPRTVSREWRVMPTVADTLLEMCNHRDWSKAKDLLPLITTAVMSEMDRADDKAVEAHLVILDSDNGESIEAAVEGLLRLGVTGVVATSFSHGKAEIVVKHDDVVKHLANKADRVTAEALRAAIGDKLLPSIVAGIAEVPEKKPLIRYAKDKKTGNPTPIIDQVYPVAIRPLTKYRVLVPLARAVPLNSDDARHAFKELVAGFAQAVGLQTVDPASFRVSQPWFLPAHRAGAENYEVHLVGGALLDPSTIEPAKLPRSAGGAGVAKGGGTAGGPLKTKRLGALARKYGTDCFQFGRLFEEYGGDAVRSGSGVIQADCPNASMHTDPTDVRGFGACDAGEGSSEEARGWARCLHGHCFNVLSSWDYVDLLCQQVGILDAAELEPFVVPKEDDPEFTLDDVAPAPFASLKDAEEALKGLGDVEGATIYARRLGATPSDVIFEARKVLLKEEVTKKTGAKARALNTAMKDGAIYRAREAKSGRTKGDDKEVALQRFNDRFAFVTLGSKLRVIDVQDMEDETGSPKFLEEKAFHSLMANDEVLLIDAQGEESLFPVSQAWKRWDKRRTYSGTVFAPDKPIGLTEGKWFNLYRGLAVQPRRGGSWEKMRAHIYENICLSNDVHFGYLMTWIAHRFRFPHEKPHWSVVIKGRKGVGKSKVFDWLRRALGAHGLQVDKTDQLTGRFNGHLGNRILVVAEEATWGGEKGNAGALKNLITSPTMPLEDKGEKLVEVRSCAGFVFLTNEPWAVPAGGEDERRYFVLECGDARHNDIAYFAAIDKEMECGGLEAMLADLMEWEPVTGTWQVVKGKPPVTPWLRQQALHGEGLADQFLRLIVENDGAMEYREDDGNSQTFQLRHDTKSNVPLPVFRKSFEQFTRKVTGRGQDSLQRHGAKLDEVLSARRVASTFENVLDAGGIKGKTDCWQLPPLNSLKEAFYCRHPEERPVLEAEDTGRATDDGSAEGANGLRETADLIATDATLGAKIIPFVDAAAWLGDEGAKRVMSDPRVDTAVRYLAARRA